jgi:hypothetical protein
MRLWGDEAPEIETGEGDGLPEPMDSEEGELVEDLEDYTYTTEDHE